MIVKTSPTIIQLQGYDDKKAELLRHLTFIDSSVDYEIMKFKKGAYWYATKYGPEAYNDHLEELKAKRKHELLYENKDGTFWTYSGLAEQLASTFDDQVRVDYKLPEPHLIPLDHLFKHKPRYYQQEGVDELIKIGHGAIEFGTGLGKTQCLAMLLKHYGLKSVIITPSVNIANQIYTELEYLFGKNKVGRFFGGKKESGKLFIVAVDDSVANIQKDDEHYEQFKNVKVLCWDEVHTCATDILSRVALLGPLSNAPYRFFVSGTVMRNDGRDLLLDAITGPVVKRMTVREGVDQGFLAKPEFRMVWIDSKAQCRSDDPKKQVTAHVYNNPQIAQTAAELANKAVGLMGKQVVILVKEFSQFARLLPYLRHDVRFAHGGVTAANKKLIPKEYHKSDPEQLVNDFNQGKFPILVGTSCISTGTDIQTVGAILFLRGGKSPIDVAQSVGRGTRKPMGKEDCLFVDFGISNVPMLKKHAEARRLIYRDIYPSYDELDL